jgi:hypothetical protein
MDAHAIMFDAAPANGAAARLVIARGTDGEVFRDRFDTSRAASREKFARLLAKLLGADPAELVARCHAELPRLADAADQAAAEQAAAAPPPPAGQGQPLLLADPEPWPEPVTLADVLAEAVAAVRRHIWVGENEAVAAALWAAWAYHVQAFDVAPLLRVTSPVKRCGKTTFGRVLAAMLPRVLSVSSITPAALFRAIEQAHPTLVIDEADAFLAGCDELRGLLNAGHTRGSAFVVRVEGDDHQPRVFSVFGAKLLLGIGGLAPTIEDRSVSLALERKPPGAAVARLTRRALAVLRDVGRRFARWAADHGDQIDADADPDVPEVLNDRQADCWRPLFHLADLAGGDWPRRARQAAVALAVTDEDELPLRLLADLRAVFVASGRDALATGELLGLLRKLPDSPWPTLCHGRPITPHRLARTLAPFGVRPYHSKNFRGYRRKDFEAVWDRYCPPATPPDRPQNEKPPTPRNKVSPSSPADAKAYQYRIYGVTLCFAATLSVKQSVPP